MGRSIFPRKKTFAPPQKHLDLNIHQESNLPPLAPLGSQAGGLTTRPDLYGLGKNWENPRTSGNCQIKVPTGRFGYQNVQNFGANNFVFYPKSGHSRFLVLFLKKVFPNGGT